MKSQKATWLTIILVTLAVPVIWFLFRLLIPNYSNASSGMNYFINIALHELMLVIFVLLSNHFIVHQKITFQNDNTFKDALFQ